MASFDWFYPESLFSGPDSALLRHYEDAATAVGRLDSAASASSRGLRDLAVLRCIATPTGASRRILTGLLRPDGGERAMRSYSGAVRAGASRARGGVVPSLDYLCELLGLPMQREPPAAQAAADAPIWGMPEVAAFMSDDRLRHSPPVLRAVMTAGVLLNSPVEGRINLASLATSLVLCVGGAMTDVWLTLPLCSDEALGRGPKLKREVDGWLAHAFLALANEARAAERALGTARERVESDRARVKATFGRAAYSALDVLDLLTSELVITVPETSRTLRQTPPTTGAAIARLTEIGIVEEITGQSRSRAYIYGNLIDAFASQGAAS